METSKVNTSGRMLKRSTLFLAVALCFAGCKKELKATNEPSNAVLSKFAVVQTSVANLTEMKVMSFNVRSEDPDDPQTMQERKESIRRIIVDNTPDVFGLQEFSNNAFEDWFRLKMDSLGYDRYDDEQAGLGTPKVIFFKANRFTLLGSGTFPIDAQNIRAATWVILLDNVNSKQYFFCNSHWSANSVNNDSEKKVNAQAVINAVQLYNPNDLPAIILGDTNSEPGTSQMVNLRNSLGLVDAGDDQKTYHGWDATGDYKVDYLLCNKSFAFTTFKVIKTTYNGFWPSDHWPVMATFTPAIFGAPHADVYGISGSTNTEYYFADVNGDGKDDKIYHNHTFDSGKARVYLSNGNGTFASSAVAHTAGASTLATTRYHFSDVDGDGKADLIRWDPNLNSGHTRVYLATTNGNFNSTVVDNPEGGSQGTTTVFNFADVNGDGKADKIYWNHTFDDGKTRVYLATTGGSFSGTVVAGSEGASTTADTKFYYADVNGDGKLDKILWHPSLNSGKTMVYLSDGDGTFTASSSFSNSGATSGASTTRFYFPDINGDGRAEKIYWNPGNYLGKIKVYYSQTNNAFNGPVYSLWGSSQSPNTYFYYADINGDGKADQNRWNYAEANGELRNYFAK